MFELTKQLMTELMTDLLNRAKYNRERVGYSGHFQQCILVVAPNGAKAILPLEWRSDQEKQISCAALCYAAKKVNAAAVVTITIAKWVDSTAFANYFHTTPFDGSKESYERHLAEYTEIMRTTYGGEIAMLPRELWDEALVVACMGPLIEDDSLMAAYREGKGNTIEWIPNDVMDNDHGTKFQFIEKWWEETVPQ